MYMSFNIYIYIMNNIIFHREREHCFQKRKEKYLCLNVESDCCVKVSWFAMQVSLKRKIGHVFYLYPRARMKERKRGLLLSFIVLQVGILLKTKWDNLHNPNNFGKNQTFSIIKEMLLQSAVIRIRII